MVHFTSFGLVFVVVWWLRCSVKFPETSELNFRDVDAELLIFHFNVLGPSLRFFHFTAMDSWTLNWLHVWFWKLHTGCQFFLANLMNFNFVFWWWNTGRLNWQTSFFLAWKLRDDLTLLEILGEIPLLLLWAWGKTSKADLLAGKRTRCWGEKTSAKHSDFWQRWQEDSTYPSRLATSRERILGQPCSVEQLRESTWSCLRKRSNFFTEVSAPSSEPWTSTSRAGSPTSTSVKVVDFRMAGNNQRMNFANKPFDNCLLLYQLSFQEFFYSFWSGNTLHKLLDPELPMGRKIEMMFSFTFLQQKKIIQKNFVGRHGDPSTHLKSSIYFRTSLRFVFVDFSNISMPFQDHCSRTSWQGRTCTSVWVCAMWTSMKGHFYPMEFVEERHFSHFCLHDQLLHVTS